MCPCNRSVITTRPLSRSAQPRRRWPSARLSWIPPSRRAMPGSRRLQRPSRRRRPLANRRMPSASPSRQSIRTTPSSWSKPASQRDSRSLRASQKIGQRGDVVRSSGPRAKLMSGHRALGTRNASRTSARLPRSRTRSVRAGCPSKIRRALSRVDVSRKWMVCGSWTIGYSGKSRITRSRKRCVSGHRSPRLPPPAQRIDPRGSRRRSSAGA